MIGLGNESVTTWILATVAIFGGSALVFAHGFAKAKEESQNVLDKYEEMLLKAREKQKNDRQKAEEEATEGAEIVGELPEGMKRTM